MLVVEGPPEGENWGEIAKGKILGSTFINLL